MCHIHAFSDNLIPVAHAFSYCNKDNACGYISDCCFHGSLSVHSLYMESLSSH